MTNDTPSERLEHLISRFLDDEATSAERRELSAALDREPTARALYEETAALDREVGVALRRAIGRTLELRPAARRRGHWPQWIGVAAAAALAAMLIFRDAPRPTRIHDGQPQQASSWGFMPSAAAGDRFDPASAEYALPHVQMRDTQRDWLLVPSEQPGQILVIEVQRVKTRAIGIHGDY